MARQERCTWVRVRWTDEDGEGSIEQVWVPYCLSGALDPDTCTCEMPTPPDGRGLRRCTWVQHADRSVFVPCCPEAAQHGPGACICPMEMVSAQVLRAWVNQRLGKALRQRDLHARHGRRLYALPHEQHKPETMRAHHYWVKRTADEISLLSDFQREFETLQHLHDPEDLQDHVERAEFDVELPLATSPPRQRRPAPPDPAEQLGLFGGDDG